MLNSPKIKKNIFYICLTFDTDSDPEEDIQNPTWNNLEWFISNYNEFSSKFKFYFDTLPKITWFIRADLQVKSVFGKYCGLLDKYSRFWKEVQKDGGEIAFHPHLYSKKEGKFTKEYDEDITINQLTKILDELSQLKDFKICSSRIGEAYQSNAIIETLERYHFKQDSTAMSGRFINSEWRQIDWRNTPYNSYFPSKIDYRVSGTPSHKILEIPMSMVKTQTEYDKDIYFRYLDPAFHFNIFLDLENDLKNKDYLVSITHPFEIQPNSKTHGLLSYKVDNYFQVLNNVINIVKGKNMIPKFVTVNELGRILRDVEK